MARKKSTVRTTVFCSPSGPLDELDRLLTFQELPPFTKRWHSLALHDIDLLELQLLLLGDPKSGPVIAGTGGLRKLRWAGRDRSKRDSFRVCYVHYEEFGMILLAIVYAKNEADDISGSFKRSIRQTIESIHRKLSARPYRHRSSTTENK